MKVTSFPDHGLGYAYFPAILGVAGDSVVTAPLGARSASGMPVQQLKKVFAFLLIPTGTKMLMGIFQLWCAGYELVQIIPE